MCGIVGAIAPEDVTETLLTGLKRLEYRGYDSAGLAVFGADQGITRLRRMGKVAGLEEAVNDAGASGLIGIAHTRWATHGEPAEKNAHPHQGEPSLCLVHNGIIENYVALKSDLQGAGVSFTSDTDSEVLAHHLAAQFNGRADKAVAPTATDVAAALEEVEGAYALAIMVEGFTDRLMLAKHGSPLVVGFGDGAAYIASDPMAIAGKADRFVFLEDGDCGVLTRDGVTLVDAAGNAVDRPAKPLMVDPQDADKGNYEHYMLKEIHEQPAAIARTLEGRIEGTRIATGTLPDVARLALEQARMVHIVACGTSYHAGLVAAYWLERYAGVSAMVEIASEYRYRQPHVAQDSIMVVISQSGETADTLAALKMAKGLGYLARIAICNVNQSSIVREADHALLTHAGPEIGVASTKAFTTQLTALLMMTALMPRVSDAHKEQMTTALRELPMVVERILSLDEDIRGMAAAIANRPNALFLGRGEQYPVAMEGALKLKEISYIHAEAYAAGELKHGPLALIDATMPVIVVAPDNELVDKLKSNLEEVRARGGALYVFASKEAQVNPEGLAGLVTMPRVGDFAAPIAYTLPLQLLSYHVAHIRGTDIDQPRNLAKSVTVE
ncbi:MAG: glutamine--fructose-6-phosphate transaminase (isomerizing) [Alphaproteobacteria bacterium]